MAVLEALDLRLKPERSREVARMLSDNWHGALDARQALDQKIAAWWERYEGSPPNRDLRFKQASNLRVPLTMWTVDAVWVRQMRAIFGQKPYINIFDENQQISPDSGPIEQVVQHLAETDLRMRLTVGHLLLNALVEGTGIAKLTRVEEGRRVRDRVGDFLMEQMVVDHSGLGLEVIDFKDFAVANNAQSDINKQPWVAHRSWLRWDDIVRRQRDGIYTITQAQLSDLKSKGKRRRLAESRPLEQVKATLDRSEDAGYSSFEEWEVIEVIARYDYDDDGLEDECLFASAVDWLDGTLRAQGYPFWNGARNYIAYRPMPRVNRFPGRSLAGIMQPMQDEADAEINQSLDASTFTILAHLSPILPRSLKREWENHKWDLGKPIYVDSPETFRSLADIIKHPIQLSNIQLGQIFQLAERSSGVSDPTLGKPSAGSKTAFEISTVQTEGNIRFSEMIEQNQMANQELAYQIIEHAYQLSLEDPAFRERLIRVVGKDPFENVAMADIRRRLAVVPSGNSITANKEQEARKWATVWQIAGPHPLVQADLSRVHYLLTQVLKSLGVSEPELVIGTKEETEAAKQLIKQAADQAAPIAGQIAATQGPEGVMGMMGGQ